MSVALQPYDPGWPARAVQEIALWTSLLGEALVACHHIGSTAVPGLAAKPVIDLLPVVRDHSHTEAAFETLTEAGYIAKGAYGLPRRRFFQKFSPDGARLIHAHAYEQGSPEITRHLAFRDLLRADPGIRSIYEKLKCDCAATSRTREAYGLCKDQWIKQHEALALNRFSPDR